MAFQNRKVKHPAELRLAQIRPVHEELIFFRVTGAKSYCRGIFLQTATGNVIIDTATGMRHMLTRIKGWVPRKPGKSLWA